MLIHVGCGGEVQDDWSKTYDYQADDDGQVCKVPAHRCAKCGLEIMGDDEVHVEGMDDP